MSRFSFRSYLAVWCVLTLGSFSPAMLSAMTAFQEPDSVDLRKQAEEEQARFESYRESRMPPQRARPVPRQCDDIIGRFCLFYDDGGSIEDDVLPEAEVPEVSMARTELLRTLTSVARDIPGDDWVLGQRVFYLNQVGQARNAEGMLRRCDGPTRWWCSTLLGYVLQSQGRSIEAGGVFEEALAEMPPGEAAFYRSPEFLLNREGRGYLDDLNDEERMQFVDYLWRFADPLYLVDGNDRLVEHYARKVSVRIQENAENIWRLDWGEDLEELLIRFGEHNEYARSRGLQDMNLDLQDDRGMVGFRDPRSQQFIADGTLSSAPAEIRHGEWRPEKMRPRTAHIASYAPSLDLLHTQVARFRRGDSLFVVAGFRPNLESGERQRQLAQARSDAVDPFSSNPFGFSGPDGGFQLPPPQDGQVKTGLILVSEAGGEMIVEESSLTQGTMTLYAAPGRYIAGVEVYDEINQRGWRDRHGVIQEPLPFGVSSLSDLLILEERPEPPESLDEALPFVLPSLGLSVGQSFTAAWEVYGLLEGEVADVTIGVGEVEVGFFDRVGEFLGLTNDDQPVVLSWEEAAEDNRKTIFRAVNLQMPELPPGDYILRLLVDVRGRTPMEVTRKIQIGAFE